jgi:excisionase family DNA binding protein
MEELLEVSAVAKLLNLNPATVRNMIKRGELRAVNLNAGTGRRATWRVPLSAVLEKLEKANPKALASF